MMNRTMDNKDIYVVGDVHGQFNDLNVFINKKKPDIVLQCGDFGYWPKFDHETIKNPRTKIYFCDGNHEDHDALGGLVENEVFPNVYYMKRGSVLTLPDNRNVLFIGGALSIDKEYRTPHYDWFEQEVISEKDISSLPDINIDIVISHTAPLKFVLFDYHYDYKFYDVSRDLLDVVFDKYKPKLWYFGHMHKQSHGYEEKCEWFGLSAVRFPGIWYIKLKGV